MKNVNLDWSVLNDFPSSMVLEPNGLYVYVSEHFWDINNTRKSAALPVISIEFNSGVSQDTLESLQNSEDEYRDLKDNPIKGDMMECAESINVEKLVKECLL